MSLPGSVISSLPAVVSMNPMDALVASINSNPYFIGIMMVLLNIGGRFLSLEVSKEQEKFLSSPTVRRLLLFAVLFIGTRNILVAACLTIILVLFIGYLFNENSELCIWHSCTYKHPPKNTEAPTASALTLEEQMILKRLQDKNNASAPDKEVSLKTNDISASSYYMSSIQFLTR